MLLALINAVLVLGNVRRMDWLTIYSVKLDKD